MLGTSGVSSGGTREPEERHEATHDPAVPMSPGHMGALRFAHVVSIRLQPAPRACVAVPRITRHSAGQS